MTMRSEEEIRDVFLNLGMKINEKGVQFDVQAADNFQYGLFMGKLTALGWVLGVDRSSGDMGSHYDYEDFILEQRSRLVSSSRPAGVFCRSCSIICRVAASTASCQRPDPKRSVYGRLR